MGGIISFIGISVLGFIGYLITSAVVRAPGVSLSKKFVSLGTLVGKSYSQISRVCGPCTSVSALNDGKKLYQWMATGYHIALIFDENDICEGVSHEASV